MLAAGGTGTSASAADLAAYVRDFDPDGDEYDDEDALDDELDAVEALDDDALAAGNVLAAEEGPGEGESGAEKSGAADDLADDLGTGDVDIEFIEIVEYDDDDEFDELGMEGLFLPVTSLWQAIGAIDEDDRLTALGWWGLPEAMRRVWAPVDDD